MACPDSDQAYPDSLKAQSDVDQIPRQRQPEQSSENSDEVHQESGRLEPAEFNLALCPAVTKQACQAQKHPPIIATVPNQTENPAVGNTRPWICIN